ncbi:hypothetical protein NQU59_11695 [Acinetobacter colistiniresistens]|uniref:hypothetical protein n=1 Tax=Acinetobacter colistiniresistens TaxID=280145 RepID=UPI00211CC60A|nr:hypothetical protein [Acinetobacter colistiniresistens]UUM26362.1 hypothetical protein NQU59_11695 [Acinetobacter colistiniresistens]
MLSEKNKYHQKFGVLPDIIVISKGDDNDLYEDLLSSFGGVVPRKRDFENCKIIVVNEYLQQPECYEENDIKLLLEKQSINPKIDFIEKVLPEESSKTKNSNEGKEKLKSCIFQAPF